MSQRARSTPRRSTRAVATTRSSSRDSAAQRRLAPERRRAQLVEIVEELFKTRPYAELGVHDVASAAGVTQGLVYHYFPTKEHLFLEAFQQRTDELLARCLPPLDSPLPELVERGIRGYLDFVEERRIVYLNLFRTATATEPEVARLCEETRWRIVDHLLAALGASGLTLPATRLSLRGYVGYCESVVLAWLEAGSPPRATVERLLQSAVLGAMRGGLSTDTASPFDEASLDALEKAYRRYFGLGST